MSKRKKRGKSHNKRRRQGKLYRAHNRRRTNKYETQPPAPASVETDYKTEIEAAAQRLEKICDKRLQASIPPSWPSAIMANPIQAAVSLSAAATEGVTPLPQPETEATPNEKASAVRSPEVLPPRAPVEPPIQASVKMSPSVVDVEQDQEQRQPARNQTTSETSSDTKRHTLSSKQQAVETTKSDIRQKSSGKISQKPQANSGPGGTPVRVSRTSNDDFRMVLANGLTACRGNLISVGIFSIVLNLLILSIPIYLFQVSDRVLTSSSVETLIMLTTVVVGALAVFALLDVVRRYILMRVAVRLETTLGGPVLSAAAKSAQSGSTRDFQTLQDLQQVRSFITGPVILAMFDAPVAPVYFLAVYLIHPHLGIIVTVAALILLVIAVVNQKITAVPFSRANAFAMRAGFQAEAMARNAQIVNAMGMIQEGVMHWGRETAEALKAQVIAQDRNVQLTGISKFLRLATQVSMLGWGAYLAIDGQLTGGMMIAASIVGSRALAPIEGLIEGWRGYVQARGGYARIKALLGNSPLNLERLTLPRPQGRLKVERVLYVPPPTKRVILNGIDFSLDPGESMAVVGPSGTGKSTLARMLVGSIAPTSGSVRLDLMDIRNWDPRQFGETVGYLPQDVQLFPGSIKANIARLREDVSDEAIFDAAELAGVHAMISQLPQGYETQISIDGTPLSGGQRQRLGLARAFFGEPRLVVLDEPNSNLDSAGERALGAALQRAKVKGITVIAVTQRPALMRSVDKIMLLNEGRIQKLGPRDEILPLLSNRNRKSITDAA